MVGVKLSRMVTVKLLTRVCDVEQEHGHQL